MTPIEKMKRPPSPNGKKASSKRNSRAKTHRFSAPKNDAQAASDPAVAAIERSLDTVALPSLMRDPEPLAFPLDALPDCLAPFCRQVAESISTSVDFIGVTMLVTAGAAIGISRAIRVKEGWDECPRFYAALVGDPGSGKTPAMAAVLQPYQKLQRREFHEYKLALEKYEQALRDQEGGRFPLIVVGGDHETASVPSLPPRPSRLIVSDVTEEALAGLLQENPRGLHLPLDELASWFRRMRRSVLNSMWSGQPLLVDRTNRRGEPIAVLRPFVNVVGGIQPDLLHLLDDKEGCRDGFLDRLLFVFPTATMAQEWTEATVSNEAMARWQDTLLYLRGLEMSRSDHGPGPAIVGLSAAAKDRWIAWMNEHRTQMRDHDLSVSLRGAWAKLENYAARFILVLHYLWLAAGDRVERDVDAATVDRAVLLLNYFKSHLRRVHGRLRQSPEEKLHDEVLTWVRRNGGTCSARDLVRARLVAPSKRAWAVLEELVVLGFGRIDEFTAANHKTARRFLLNEES